MLCENELSNRFVAPFRDIELQTKSPLARIHSSFGRSRAKKFTLARSTKKVARKEQDAAAMSGVTGASTFILLYAIAKTVSRTRPVASCTIEQGKHWNLKITCLRQSVRKTCQQRYSHMLSSSAYANISLPT